MRVDETVRYAHSIITLLMSLQAFLGVDNNQNQLQKSMERMSSGIRLNRAADGAAELSQAIALQSEQLSNMAAQRNSNDGLSMVQTAEGATRQTGEMLSRMRGLSVQAASGTLNDDQRSMIQTEISSIQSEMDRIAGVTEFNGVQLADGTNPNIKVQVGTGDTPSDAVEIKLADLRADSLGVGTSSVDVSTAGGATSALDAIDTAMDSLNEYRSNYGAVHNVRLNSSINNLETGYIAAAESESRIMDWTTAYETAEAAKKPDAHGYGARCGRTSQSD